MTPQIQYLQMMAQRFAGTPIGQWFASQAQRAMDAARGIETKWPTLPRGPGGQFPVRNLPADKLPVAPFSRGAAGVAGAGSVMAGSGQFEGVRDRLIASPEAAPAVPSSLWEELNARGAGAPPAAPAPMRAADLDGPSTYRPDYSGYGGQDSPREIMMQRALAATAAPAKAAAVRSVMPANPPMPPRPEREPVGAPMQLPSVAPQGSSEGFLSRLFGSQPEPLSSRELFERASQTDSPADFFRAERAMREGRAEGGAAMGEAPPFPSPAAPPKPSAGGRDAVITKALDIIHQLIMRGR